MKNTKTALLMPDEPNNFQIKNIILKITKDEKKKYTMEPLYIQGILYTSHSNHQQSKSF